MATDKPALLSAKEAAEWLGFSEEHVRRLAREGKIPALKAGPRSWRFYLNDLQEWLSQGRPATSQERLPFGGQR